MTFVLIPGAGGDAWYWHRVVEELRARDRDAIAPELPADDPAAGWTEYVDTVVAAVGDRTDLVVVGQSLGGYTAPLVCERLPVKELVLLNAMIPAPGETGGDWGSNTGSSAARREADLRAGRDPDGEFDPLVYFFHDVSPELTEFGMSGGKDQSETPFIQPWPAERWPDVPTTVLAGVDDRLFPVEFQERVAAQRLGLPTRRLPGGHLLALSRPVELVDALTD